MTTPIERAAEYAKAKARREELVPVECSGGFIKNATSEQREAFARLLYDWRPSKAIAHMGAGGLPEDYVYVILEFPSYDDPENPGRRRAQMPFHCGIDAEGRVSS